MCTQLGAFTLHNGLRRSSYGRLVEKPGGHNKQGSDDKKLGYPDEDMPIEDQIENLRIKIALKERYNRVLREEMEESSLGANYHAKNLYNSNKELRNRLMIALRREKDAVQSALRTHRNFQLAMTDKTPRVKPTYLTTYAIPWLEDKTFDLGKRLNELLDRLHEKREKMSDAERQVQVMEKWPRFGSTPYEMSNIEELIKLESAIEEYKVKYESAWILNAKYRNIAGILKEENGKYEPVLRVLYAQLDKHTTERKELQQMYRDAKQFRDEASQYLQSIEEDASKNRKERRRQLGRMKKSVNEVLESNLETQHKAQQEHLKREASTGNQMTVNRFRKNLEKMSQIYHRKKAEVAALQQKASQLVSVMHVKDLTYIPRRMEILSEMSVKLQEEIKCKESMRDILLKHRDALELIYWHLKYTGSLAEERFLRNCDNYEKAIGREIEERKYAQILMIEYGDIIIKVRLIILAILQRIDFGKPTPTDGSDEPSNFIGPNLKVDMGILAYKVNNLVKQVQELEALFSDDNPPQRDYGALISIPRIPQRYIRVEINQQEPEDVSDNEEDTLESIKVPTRQEIKEKSQRFISHMKIKRSFRKYPYRY